MTVGRVLAFVVAVALLCTACGSGDTAPSQDLAQDRALAEQALLVPSDLGPGWSGQARDPDDQEVEDLQELVFRAEPACNAWVEEADAAGVRLVDTEIEALIQLTPAAAESPTLALESSGFGQVEQEVKVFRTSDEVAALFDFVKNHLGLAACQIAAIDDLLRAGFDADGEGVTILTYRGTENPVGYGDQAFRIHYEITLSASDGSEADFVVDQSVVSSGRVVSFLYQTFGGDIRDTDAIVEAAFEKAVATFGSDAGG